MTGFIDLGRRFHELTGQEVDDPESLAAWSDYLPGSTTGWPELLQHARVVLLAEAGAGKTEEMRQQAKRLVEKGKYAFFVALEDLDRQRIDDVLSTDEEKRFEQWKAAVDALAWFFLDAVDELKLTRGRLERALRRLSKGLEGRLDRARIIVSCRPSDWRPLLDTDTIQRTLRLPDKSARDSSEPSEEVLLEALRHEYGLSTPEPREQREDAHPNAVHTFVMLPMSNQQIKRFAQRRGLPDVNEFLAAVRRDDAWSFARRPLDLVALMGTWKQSSRLGTRAQQHETNVTIKLQDNPDRPGNDVLSEARARDGAECLALALSLTRTRSIRSAEQALDTDRADGVLDLDGILPDWPAAERQALLRLALFDPATYGRVRFHHRSTEEYLAARRLRSLREKGMSTKALLRLLFATCYGVDVVFPSRRPIAAWLALWDDAVRKTLIDREPETLLSLGDPESLDMGTRAQLLRRFATTYGRGGWRGLNATIAEVRRLADPTLAPVIRECWNAAKNDEVRELLIEMIWQGPVESCADLAREVAFDESSTEHHRIMAIRALVECNRADDVADLAGNMLEQSTSWPDRVVCGIAADLFPKFITAEQLVTLMEKTREPKRTAGGFEWTSLQIAEAIEPLSTPALQLRDGLANLVLSGRAPENKLYNLHSRFGYLAPGLATLCGRQLAKLSGRPDDDLVRASVIASRFAGSRGGDLRGSRKDLVGTLGALMGVEPTLRRAAFWADFTFVHEIDPPADEPWRFHEIMENGVVDSLSKSDWQWLQDDLANEGRPERRPVALYALLHLWRQNGKSSSDRNDIRASLKDDQELGRVLDEQTAPPKRDESFEELKRKWQQRKRADEARESRRIQGWKKWREQLLADPAQGFSEQARDVTIGNVYSVLNALKESQNRYDVWDKSALARVFGADVANRAEEAFRRIWRSTRPVSWSARSAEARNRVPGNWILGLAGVSAEAAIRGWSTRLSPQDVRTATAYAMIELNGFAPFLADLVESHPEPVARVIGDEVGAELAMGDDHEHLPILQDLTLANSGLKRLCVPYLLEALKKWPSVVDSETSRQRARHLDQALRVLEEADEPGMRQTIAEECASRYRDDPNAPLAVVWLKGLFRFGPAPGAKLLADEFEGNSDPAIRKRAIETFAFVFGEDEPVDFPVSDRVQHARLLGRLVRLAHAFIRPEDDQVHEGVYSPDTRDHAERARSTLFQWLCNTPGTEARLALLDLAERNEFADLRDRLRLIARQRAATDAEFTPFDSRAVVALGERYEMPPNDGNGLFAIMMDRLDDLAHDLAHDDFSDRRTVRSINDEHEIQRTLSRRIKDMAKGAYRVMREDEVADAKRPDIRLATVGGVDRKVVLEVKIADKGWSLADLEHALRTQLAGQYLRHENCTGGCLLLIYRREKKYWVHPVSKKRLAFSDVVGNLRETARTLEHEHQHRIRVGVFGLDLTDEQPASG